MKSKTKATVRAKVKEQTQKLTAAVEAEALLLKAQAEEEIEASRTQFEMELKTLAQQSSIELAQACVTGSANVTASQASDDAHGDADDQKSEEDWEVLPDVSIEQCPDTTWDLVLA